MLLLPGFLYLLGTACGCLVFKMRYDRTEIALKRGALGALNVLSLVHVAHGFGIINMLSPLRSNMTGRRRAMSLHHHASA